MSAVVDFVDEYRLVMSLDLMTLVTTEEFAKLCKM